VGEVLDDEEGVMQRNVMAESIVLVKYAPISVSGEAIHCVDQSSIRRFLTLAKCLELLVTSILFRQRACAAMSKSGRSRFQGSGAKGGVIIKWNDKDEGKESVD